MTKACSIPARCFRPCTAAPNSAACTSMPDAWHFPTCRDSKTSTRGNERRNALMKFGLFTSAQANSGDLGPESGQGFRDYLDFAVAAEQLGFVSSFLVEHHFTGWNQV